MTVSEKLKALLELAPNTPLLLKTMTKVVLTQPNNPYFAEVRKDVEEEVTIHADFALEVNKQKTAEGQKADYVPEPLRAGVYIEPGKSIIFNETKNTYYLGVISHKVVSTKYLYKGKEIEKSEFEKWLPKPLGKNSQGLANPVNFKMYKLEDIQNRK